jgi:DNA-binding MarR family transcriptional regulator
VTTPDPVPAPAPTRSWTLLTNHGRLLLLIAAHPDARLRDLAAQAGITERAAGSIVGDLQEAGYVTVSRQGRRNTYVVHTDQPFRHPAEAGHDVGELLRVFA